MTRRASNGLVVEQPEILVTFSQEEKYPEIPLFGLLTVPKGTQLIEEIKPNAAHGRPEMTLRIGLRGWHLPEDGFVIEQTDHRQTMDTIIAAKEAEAFAAVSVQEWALAKVAYEQAIAQHVMNNNIERAIHLQHVLNPITNTLAQTSESRANFAERIQKLGPRDYQQLGQVVLQLFGQLGAYQYRPATRYEGHLVWEALAAAVHEAEHLPYWRRECKKERSVPRSLTTITMDHIVGELLTEVTDGGEMLAARGHFARILDPDDADAYCLVGTAAVEKGDWETAKRWYAAGVEAGTRRLADGYPSSYALEDLPYFRATVAFANACYRLGDVTEAIDTYEMLLRARPDDRQNVRYDLASLYLEQGNLDGFATLQHQWQQRVGNARNTKGVDDEEAQEDEDRDSYESIMWLVPQVLYHFATSGDTPANRAMLRAVIATNAHVLPLLLYLRHIPTIFEQQDWSPGSHEEAMNYAAIGLRSWQVIPGALQWLRLVTS